MGEGNGGVVVGDKTNHAPAVHTAQLLYLTVLASAPFIMGDLTVRLGATLRSAWGAARSAPLLAAAALLLPVALARGTHCHPFLLADNRHVTFYAWRCARCTAPPPSHPHSWRGQCRR